MDLDSLQQAFLLTQQGKFSEAKDIYLKLLESNPDNDIVLSTFGLYYVFIKDYDNAAKLLEKAYSVRKTFGTVSAFGFCLFKKGDYIKASDILEEALSYGENTEVYHNLVSSLFYIKSTQKAIKYATEMYEKYPDNVNSVINVVKALTYCGKMLKAEELCVNYLKEHNDVAQLWFQLGFLKELIYSDDKQACECYKVALDLGHKEAYYNIAVSYGKIGDFQNAELNFKKMLEFYPNNVDAITSLGMCYLQQKKFKEGYDLFFKREKIKRNFTINNYWNPDKTFEKDIQIICDQGFGDHIQFIRYLPFLTSKTENIYVLALEPLKGLFQKNYPSVKFISESEINPDMQTIRITDLAYALNMNFDNIPYADGYLSSDSIEIKSDKIKAGLCWEAGSAAIRTMINRTINIKFLEPILNLKEVQIYSFQVQDSLHGNEKYPQMINLAKNFNNFEDTAKALKAMDVVITVDTALAHLAGALGVKTFLILPYASDWRWFRDTETTPWYNSVEIFKQDSPVSWENPLKKMLEKLKDFK